MSRPPEDYDLERLPFNPTMNESFMEFILRQKETLKPKEGAEPKIYCACGCGEQLCKYDNRGRERKYIYGHIGRGRKQTKEHIEKRNSQIRGDNHPNWKGGRLTRKDKNRDEVYIQVICKTHPHATVRGYMLEHRLIMEEALGRYLKPEEVVHHINGIGTDNRLENLKLFPNNSAHLRFHRKFHGDINNE